MNLSIRNRIPGTVTAVDAGEVMAAVKVRLAGGQDVTAAVTMEAVEELGLSPGALVHTLVKSTEVALATETLTGVSIRNQLPGTVEGIATGGAMAAVKVTVAGGALTAVITRSAAEDLALAPGSPVVALIKSTEISLATG